MTGCMNIARYAQPQLGIAAEQQGAKTRPAMSSPDFKHALETWNVRTPEEIRDLLEKVEIKIIEHRPEKHDELMSSNWVQELLAEGINVSILTNP